MTLNPKEKAQRICLKYYGIPLYIKTVKQAAHYSVDEILDTLNFDIQDLDVRGSVLLDLIQYWKDVKAEIDQVHL